MSRVEVVATLIGDVVDSRAADAERIGLHQTLTAALADVNQRLQPLVDLRVTVGDEYQGVFATVGEAAHAALLLRLRLRPAHDVRHGLGWGRIHVLAAEPRVEDGPGWWAAREAIDAVHADAGRAALRVVRTGYRRAAGESTGADPDTMGAALLYRDQVLGSLSERSVMLVRGLIEGRTQTDLAAEHQISASALSQRVRRDGLGVLVRAEELLRRSA